MYQWRGLILETKQRILPVHVNAHVFLFKNFFLHVHVMYKFYTFQVHLLFVSILSIVKPNITTCTVFDRHCWPL